MVPALLLLAEAGNIDQRFTRAELTGVLFGVLISALLVLVTFHLTRHRRKLEVLVDEKTSALLASEERFRRVVTSAPVAIIAFDENGIILLAEGKGLEGLGLNAGTLGSVTIDVALGPDMDVAAHVAEVRRNGISEFICRRRDGCFQIKIAPLSADNVLGGSRYTAVITDITSSDQMQRITRRNENLLRSLHLITSSTDLSFDEKVDEVLRLGCGHFSLEMAAFGKVEGLNFRPLNLWPRDLPTSSSGFVPLEKTYAMFAYESDRPVGFHYPTEAELTQHPANPHIRMGAFLGCSVRTEEGRFGTVGFGSKFPRTRAFVEEDYAFVRLLSDWISHELIRKRILDRLQFRVQFEQLLISISTKFISLPADELNAGINHAIEALGEFTESDACFIVPGGPADRLRVSHCWKRDPSKPLLRDPSGGFDDVYSAVQDDSAWFDEPAEATGDARTAHLRDMRRMMAVSIERRDGRFGLLVLEAADGLHSAIGENATLIKVVAQMIQSLIERVNAQQELLASRERLNAIVASLDEVVWSGCPKTGRMLYISASAEKTYGHSAQQFYDDPSLWLKLVHEEDRDGVLRYIRELQEKGFVRMEYRIVRPDGEVRWVSDRGTLARDGAGDAIRFDGIVSDITDQKLAAQALIESQQRLQSILQGSPILLYSIDANGLITLAEGRGLVGLHPPGAQMVGQSINTLYASKPELIADWTRALRGESFTTISELRGYVFETWYSPLRAADGSLKGAVSVGTDITARQFAEEALRESEERFRRLASATSEGVAILRNGAIVDANQTMAILFGFKLSELIGKSLTELIVPEGRRPLEGRLKTRSEESFESYGLRKDKSAFPIEIDSRLLSHDIEPSRVTLIRDITPQKKIFEELRHARDVAEEAARAKTEFLANVSHEIRTPLNAILGISDLLAHTEIAPGQLEYVKTIQSSGSALLEVINDILDSAKIEAGKMELEIVPFHLREFVRESGELLAHKARSKGLHFATEVDESLPTYACGDMARIRQVLLNLINNAIKFTESGEVVIRVDRLAERCTPERVAVRFSITDTGVGIPADRKDRLFKPFSQIDTSTTRRYGGTGLGLAISLQLVQAMGGTLDVESRRGEGSCFFFVLNLPLSPESSQQWKGTGALAPSRLSPNPPVGKTARLLLVEDHAVNQMVAERMLEKLGLTVETVHSGRAAIEAIRARDYDLVFMDCQMPEMDGYEATRRIRAAEKPGTHLPIVAMTAHAMTGDREKCLESGMDDYLSKPITLERLSDVISSFLPNVVCATQIDATREDRQAETVSLQTLSSIYGTDRTGLAALIQIFIEDTERRLELIGKAHVSGDAAGIRHLAHSLKGSCANVGAERMREISSRLESSARDPDSRETEDFIQQLRGEFILVGEALERYLHTPKASFRVGSSRPAKS